MNHKPPSLTLDTITRVGRGSASPLADPSPKVTDAVIPPRDVSPSVEMLAVVKNDLRQYRKWYACTPILLSVMLGVGVMSGSTFLALLFFWVVGFAILNAPPLIVGDRFNNLPRRSTGILPSSADMAKTPVRISAEDVCMLEWKQFEILCCYYLRWMGMSPQRSVKLFDTGADGCVDILDQSRKIICQCKCWSKPVGLPQVREFLGAITDIGDSSVGYYFSANGFTQQAEEFCSKHGVAMIAADDIIRRFNSVSRADRLACTSAVFTSDSRVPTCPSCDIKMVERSGRNKFWGCRNFPRCRQKMQIRTV